MSADLIFRPLFTEARRQKVRKMGHNRGEETQQAVATCYRRTPENSGNVPNPPKLESLAPVSKGPAGRSFSMNTLSGHLYSS